MRKTSLSFFLIFALLSTLKAAYQPVTLTPSSYTKDVVANGTGTSAATTTSGFDGTATSSFAFAAQDYKSNASCLPLNSGEGLPANGQLIGQGQFQLAAYTGNNALQLTSTTPTGTLTLVTPIATTDFYLLAASGSGAGTMDMTVTFTDATTELYTAINIDDWYGGSNVVYRGARIQRNLVSCGGTNASANGPNLYEFAFPISLVNQSKLIASISFTRTNSATAPVINIMALSTAVSCTGAVAGTVSSSHASVCSGQSFKLFSTFYTGNSLQWQEAPTGTSNWVAIPGATSGSFTVTGQSIAMDYRAIATCNASTIASNVITVGMNPFYDCYCSPLSGTVLHTTSTDRITNITITGTTLNSSNGVSATGTGYSKMNPATAANTASLMQGAQYTITATKTSGAGTNPVDGWIDYDQNGIFDGYEYISFSASSPSNGYIVVPASSPTGLTGMRIRYRTTSTTFGASGACTSAGDETEDYTVTIIPAVNCSGTPAAATASATVSSICPNTRFILNATNLVIGSGISYQWEEMPSGGSWNPIAGATNPTHTLSAGATIATDYRLVTICVTGGSNPSNIVSVTMNPFYDCYCSPLSGTTLHTTGTDRITNVTIAGTTLNSSNGVSATGTGYSKINPATAANTANLMLGAQYTIIATKTSAAGTNPVDGWIDYDQNGIFDGHEYISFSASSPSNGSTLVPPSSPTGLTGMRIRYRTTTTMFGASGACTNGGNETEDYIVTIIPAVNCNGTPAAATASATASNVCPNTPFTLNATNVVIGSSVSYQWEAMPSGGSWSPITGATNPSHTIAGITTSTDYRLITACAFGGANASNSVSVVVNSPTQCYCTPLYTAGCSFSNVSIRIDGVNLPGTNSTAITNMNSGCSTNGYGSYLNLSANLEQGVSYSASLTLVNSISAQVQTVPSIAAWIDFNDDGVFSNTEIVANTATAVNGGVMTLNIPVPLTASLGAHRMRFRYVYDNLGPAMDPCTDLVAGEAEDYMVTIVPSNNCSGTPATPTVSTSLSTICFNASFTLSAVGITSGSGVSYQWEERPQGSGWTPVANATTTSYTVTGGIPVPTDYRLVTTCAFGSSSTSNSVLVAPGTPAQCVCTPVYGLGGCSYLSTEVRIESVNLTGANSTAINNTASGCSAAGYGTYLNQSVDLAQGFSYNVAMSFVNNTGVSSAGVAIWIDMDNDGVFSNTTERLANVAVTTMTATIPLTIPSVAAVGAHRMRIRYTYVGGSGMDPCGDLVLGETEDYMVTIVPTANCSGTPATPTASSSLNVICPNASFTVSATGTTNGPGISYHWEEMPQGGSWTPIANATNLSHTVTGSITVPTNYRLVTTCAFGSSSSTSNAVAVTPGTPTQCYCTPIYGLGCSFSTFSALIQDVSLTGATSTAISNTTTGCSPAGYGIYLNQSADLEQGFSYNVVMNFVNTITNGSSPRVAIWIDLDNDGVFNNTSEQLGNVATTTLSATVPFTIPATALLGVHRMRIRYTYDAAAASAMDPCADLDLGEAEDYTVRVIAPVSIGLLDIKARNEGTTNLITWTTATEDKGDRFVLERSTNGKDYDAIAFLAAKGQASAYDYRDETAPMGTSYYRLKMSGAGGKDHYSGTVSAYRKNPSYLNAFLYPNPAHTAITIELAVAKEQKIRYEVVDIVGKVILTGDWQVATGTNRKELDIAPVASGNYYIKINGEEATSILSFIKH